MFRDKDWQKRCKQEQELISPNLGACLLAESGIAYASERSFHASLSLSIRPTERASEKAKFAALFPSLFFAPFFRWQSHKLLLGWVLPPSLPPSFGPSYSRTTGSSMGGECMDGPRRGPQVL